MLHTIRIITGILCGCLIILCLSLVGNAEREEHRLCAELTEQADGSWQWTVCGLSDVFPSGTEGQIALIFDLSLGETGMVPKIERSTEEMTLTVGKPSGSRVRVLLDGKLPQTEGNRLPLLNIQMLAGGEYIPCVEAATLWVSHIDGRIFGYPLTVVMDRLGETDSETETESVTHTETSACSEVTDIPETAFPESSPSETQPAVAETETERETVLLQSGMPVYIGCRETTISLRDNAFSVKLLFWCPEGAPTPSVLCFGGGQTVTLTEERLGGTSVVVYTYRRLQADGECRFLIDVSDGIVEILYRNGRFIRHAEKAPSVP